MTKLDTQNPGIEFLSEREESKKYSKDGQVVRVMSVLRISFGDIIWVQNCLGNIVFSCFFRSVQVSLNSCSSNVLCYLHYVGAGSCYLNDICNALEL